ncbi:uncharacterized protein LOC132719717 [Ruditapes philippinarum]|uniref:uncharacterized protein LOC132719717 n=1 Tax=Ruditapes philippinarum TaxID=129788 RepID=UPI00295A9F53|nr:uncharacterized protein LOC132719717 [Ruditapes philippinarum]
MNDNAKQWSDDTAVDTEVQSLDKLFLEKEELVSKYIHEMEQFSGNRSSFDRNLWILRKEMLRLMQSDIELWKKLQELDALLAAVKEDILPQNFGYACSGTLSSASSGTESFVSAEEYNDVIFSVPNENRVKIWIENSDFCNSDYTKNLPKDENDRFRSEAFSDIDLNTNTEWLVQENLHKSYIIDQLLNSFRISKSVSNKKEINKKCSINYLQGLLNSYLLGPTIFVDLKRPLIMKSMREIEISSREDITYYKSSLRLLGSIRMQSRIFEPSLTKWRPFALSQTSDSFIIVPPTSFSNIQPRPKLHRLASVSDSGRVYITTFLTDTEENPENNKLDANENCLKESLNNIDISKELLITACKESDHTAYSLAEVCDVTNDNNETKSDTEKEASEVNVDVISSEFLELKDGFITCRILIPGTDEDLNPPLLDQDEFEYLIIDDGRVTFTPHERDADSGETYFLGWLFENKKGDEETYYIFPKTKF